MDPSASAYRIADEMTESEAPTPTPDSRARVPQHVVYRPFVNETVVLNLETGKYHGLNPTAGRMLETIEREATLHDAAVRLAAEYELPIEEIERDLLELCRTLAERGLIELSEGSPS